MNHVATLAYEIIATIALCAIGCAREIKPPSEYHDSFVKFSYPAHWSFEKEEGTEDTITTTTLTIEPPDGVASVQVFRPGIHVDGEKFATNILRSMDEQLRTDYAIGSFEILKKLDGRKTLKSRRISGMERKGIEQHASITVLGQKLPMTQEVFVVEGERASVVLFYQSADEDLQRDGPGYDLIFSSLAISPDPSSGRDREQR